MYKPTSNSKYWIWNIGTKIPFFVILHHWVHYVTVINNIAHSPWLCSWLLLATWYNGSRLIGMRPICTLTIIQSTSWPKSITNDCPEVCRAVASLQEWFSCITSSGFLLVVGRAIIPLLTERDGNLSSSRKAFLPVYFDSYWILAIALYLPVNSFMKYNWI